MRGSLPGGWRPSAHPAPLRVEVFAGDGDGAGDLKRGPLATTVGLVLCPRPVAVANWRIPRR